MNGAIEQNIIRFIAEHNLVGKGDKLLIAFSGGADSLFALNFFYKFKLKYGIELSAFHINHLLRGSESDGDEQFCKSFCEELNIQFGSTTVDVKALAKQNKESVEEAARNIRYRKLQEYASKISATKIVTAHNLNDNTETVLLNLFRGTGLNGVSGIPIKRANIIRPLLSTSKEDIVNYLTANSIAFRTDSSNLANDFSRNFLRNEIIPKLKEKINPTLDTNILKFSTIVKASNRIITSIAEDIAKRYISKNNGGIEISDLLLQENSEDIFSVIVRFAIEEEFKITSTFTDISQIKNLFALNVGSKMDLSEKLSAIRERNHILIIKKGENKIDSTPTIIELNAIVEVEGCIIHVQSAEKDEIDFSKPQNIEFIAGDNLTFPLTIRRWKEGDKFHPIGLNGTKKISDFLNEVKVSSSKKKKQLILVDGEKIIWVVGYRIDESVKIKNDTKRIVKLWVK